MNNWEKCVIGTVISEPTTINEASILLPSDFTGANQIAWAEMLALNNQGGLGIRSITEVLRNNRDFRRASDAGSSEAYIQDVVSYRGGEIQTYVDKVMDESTRRAIQRMSALLAIDAANEKKTAEELLDYVERKLIELRRVDHTETGVSMADLMSLFIPKIEQQRAGTFRPAWTPAIQGLKDIIMFAEHADFIGIAGRPGDAKSSLMRYEFYNHVMNGGKAWIANLENDPSEYARNFIALDTGIDSAKMKDPRRLTDQEMNACKASAERLSRLPLKIKTLPGASVKELVRTARTAITTEGVDLIGVDYIQLMNNGMDDKNLDVSISSSGLRALALESNVPVFANSQLSRAIETRSADHNEPQLSDLRQSGSLEQDFTIVVFPRRMTAGPNQYRLFPENIVDGHLLDRPKAVPMRFFVKKNRNGEIGTSDPIKWVMSTGNFQTLQRGSI